MDISSLTVIALTAEDAMTYYFPNGILRSQSPFGRLAIPILSNIAACAEEIFFLDEVGGDNYKERISYTVEIHVAHTS